MYRHTHSTFMNNESLLEKYLKEKEQLGKLKLFKEIVLHFCGKLYKKRKYFCNSTKKQMFLSNIRNTDDDARAGSRSHFV